jgi:hypothetical protein
MRTVHGRGCGWLPVRVQLGQLARKSGKAQVAVFDDAMVTVLKSEGAAKELKSKDFDV